MWLNGIIGRTAGLVAVCVGLGLSAVGCGARHTLAVGKPGSARLRTISFRPIDGGPKYFAHLSPRGAWMDGHVLLGAWMEQPMSAAEVADGVKIGENIYWNLSGHPGADRVDYDVIRAGGMHVSAPDTTANSGSETVMYDGIDEADGDFGPGWNAWNENGTYNQSACVPSGSKCGFTVAKLFYTGRPSSYKSPSYPINGTAIHQGFGLPLLFFETDQQAATFERYSDILSADMYWLTNSHAGEPVEGGCAFPQDPAACGGGSGPGLTSAKAHLPANYAYNVYTLENDQKLNGPSKPVAVDVETGCPGTDGICVTPSQSIAAAWHALIAGARGIIWFQHNFSGPCQDYRTFIDGSNPSSSMYNCQQTPGVTLHDLVVAIGAFDHEVQSLNGVLLSPTAVGYVSTTGDVSTMAKAYGGRCYVFAGSGQPITPPAANQSVTFSLADGYTGPVTVYDENRTLQAEGGHFTDTFANANSIHVYRSAGGSTCARPQIASLTVTPRSFRASPERLASTGVIN